MNEITIGFKLKAVKLAEATSNRNLGINEKLVRKWRN